MQRGGVKPNDMWHPLLESVAKRRSYDARFFKPLCLIAVLDGMDTEKFDANDIIPEVAIELFRQRVASHFPQRAHLGWQPFWHLSNDGAWEFFHEGNRVRPENFGEQCKPKTRNSLLRNIDRVSVPPRMQVAWALPSSRNDLRSGILEMLANDADPDCQKFAAWLSSDDLNVIAGHQVLRATEPNLTGQGFLASASARRAVEQHAMRLAVASLEADGWHVQDVSTNSSYDLLCTAGDKRRYVEVKGTTEDGYASGKGRGDGV